MFLLLVSFDIIGVLLKILDFLFIAEQHLEQHILQEQCQRLQHSNHELNLTAETLSLRMAVSMVALYTVSHCYSGVQIGGYIMI